MTYLSTEQVEQLLRPINPARVSVREGMSHLEAYDCRAHLNRVIGFGRWSCDLVALDLLFEQVGPKYNDDKKIVVTVGYRATVRLTVCAPDGTQLATYTEAATGDATNFPINKRADAHDFAIKTAESQAFKRTCVNLGDQWGVSLYQKGSRAALVKRTLVMPDGPVSNGETVDHDAPDVVPETGEGNGGAPQTPAAPAVATPSPPAPAENPDGVVAPDGVDVSSSSPEADVEALRERVLAAMDLPKQEAIRTYARLQLDIAKAGVQGVLVTSPAGVEMTLGALVSQALDFVSKPRQGNAAADAAAGEAKAS